MKIFVSGAAGFIGSAVTTALARRGHEVIAFDSEPFERKEEIDVSLLESRGGGILEKEERVEEPESEEFLEEEYEHEEKVYKEEGNVKYIQGDLLKGGQWRNEILSCDRVISLTKPFSEIEDITDREIEEYGTKHAEEVASLLEAMSEGQAKTALVTYDTLCLGDRKGQLVTDVDEIRPIGFCKPLAASFETVEEIATNNQLKVVSVFPAMVYGNGSWFKELVENIQRGTANIIEPGNNYLSLLSLDDCALMYAEIAEKINKNEIFILSDNNPVRQAEFVRFICDLLGVPAPEMVGFEAYAKKFGKLDAEAMSASIRVSSEKALTMLDHELKYPRYEEGVMDVLESMGIEIRRRREERFRKAA